MTSGLMSFFVRIYNNMLQEPQDDIDPAITSAVYSLMASYSSDFAFSDVTTLDIRCVDLLGAYGEGLAAQADTCDRLKHVPRNGSGPARSVNDLWNRSPR